MKTHVTSVRKQKKSSKLSIDRGDKVISTFANLIISIKS